MLRFFRHIRKTLMEQSKVRTYLLYAIGEIALVMIGILLALQVNNWNQQRLETEFQDKMVERLIEEFKSNREELVIDIERLQTTTDALKQSIAFIDGTIGYELSENELHEMVGILMGDPTWNPSSFVLADLKSNGQISDLDNEVLIDQIFSWERFYENLLEYQIGFVEVSKRFNIHMTELGVVVNLTNHVGITNSQATVDLESIIKQDKLIYYHLHRKLIQGMSLKFQYEQSKERLDEIIEVNE